ALTSMARGLTGLAVVMVLPGRAGITVISLFTALVQRTAAHWRRARVVAVFLLVFQGALAAGSALWGAVGERAGIHTALVLAGVSCVATGAVSYFWSLPAAPADVSPWNHWRMPAVVKDLSLGLDDGPVLVTIE